ncbi:MAG: hypothetical protein ACLUKQ_00320 [Peptococcaceae bacterium]
MDNNILTAHTAYSNGSVSLWYRAIIFSEKHNLLLHYPKRRRFFQRKTALYFSSDINNSLLRYPKGAEFFSSGQAVGFWMQRRILRVRKQIHNPTTPPEGKRTSPSLF